MGLCWKVFLPVVLLNIALIAILKLIFFPPPAAGVSLAVQAATYTQWFWWIVAIIEIAFGLGVIYAFSKVAGISWFGRAERPVLVDRSVILVLNVHGGRVTIDSEARTVSVTREP
jgi:hypothetical protein